MRFIYNMIGIGIGLGIVLGALWVHMNYDLIPVETTLEKIEKDYSAGVIWGREQEKTEAEEAEMDAYDCIDEYPELGYTHLFVCPYPDTSQEVVDLTEALRLSDSAYAYGCKPQ